MLVMMAGVLACYWAIMFYCFNFMVFYADFMALC